MRVEDSFQIIGSNGRSYGDPRDDTGNTAGIKYDRGKPRTELVDPRILLGLGQVCAFGADKYDPLLPDGSRDDRTYMNNWREGMRWGRVYAAVLRHLSKWWLGQDTDEESGMPHLWHAAWGLMVLSAYSEDHRQLDDRPHPWRRQRRVFLDVDMVLADWAGALCQRGRERGVPMPNPDNVLFWDFFDRRRWNDLFSTDDEYEGFLMTLAPMIDPADLPFEPAGYVTHRSVPSSVTEGWLERHGFPYAPVVTVDNSEDKVQVLNRLGCDVFVDDKFSTFAECNNAGILCYLMDRPYNRKYAVGQYRITSLTHLRV